MIYKISQISNIATALLYPYRIVRTASNKLNELLRYSEQFTGQLVNPVVKNGVFEYVIDIELNPNKIPFIEFINPDLIPETADIYEVETTEDKLTVRSSRALSAPVDISVYEVYSLQYIADLLAKLGADLDNDSASLDDTDAETGDIKLKGRWIIAEGVKVPDLVIIDKAEDGLVYGDSECVLSGAVSSQLLVNPSQRILESMLKCITDQLTIKIVDKLHRVIQDFYNGLITIESNSETLVVKNCNAIIQFNKLDCKALIIDNCPFVFFKSDTCRIDTVEIRHSTVTIDTDAEIKRIMLSRISTVNQVRCKLETLLLLEAGSAYYVPELNDDNTIEHIESKAVQGQLCVNDQPVYLHHQNVSFRRGQVEDPLPISELKVDITISGGDTPTPSGKIYSPFTDWYWSGDSRVVQMIAATGTDGKGYGGQALSKLQEVQSEIESEGVQHNILLWWGVNGLHSSAQAYADVYKAIANTVGDNAMVFVGTVGFCPNGSGSGRVDGGAGQALDPFNEQIEEFNADLKTALTNTANIHVLDINKYIHELEDEHGAAWLTSDNLHYLPDASQAIYDWVCNQITNVKSIEVDTRFTPADFIEYVSVDISDTYMGTLPTVDTIESNIGLGIMYGICLSEYGDNPVGWLYARIFRTYLMLGYYKVFSHNLTDEGRALLNPETSIWSFGDLYSESGLLNKVHSTGSNEGLTNFYYMIKYGRVMTGYTEDMDDIDKMRVIAGGTPTGNNSETGCPQDGQFHENWYAAGIVDARWIYDSWSSWIPYGTHRMTYYADQRSGQGGTINPNIR